MKISLYQRLSLSLLLLFVVVVTLFFWWSKNLEQLSRSEAEQRLHINLAKHLAEDNPLLKQGNYEYEALKNMFHTLMILGPSFEFYFVDPKGRVLSYSAEPGKIKRENIDVTPILEILEQKKRLPILGDDPRSKYRKKIFSAASVYNKNILKGYLYIIIGSEVYDSIFKGIQSNQRLAQSLGIIFGSVVFFFIVLLALLRFLTLPLKKLTADIRRFKDSGFRGDITDLKSWPMSKNNEIHELGQTFNNMATHINRQLVQLENVDKQRRELLTHLSHDLRTPLASLQGYLETIEIKGRSISDEQHKQFIGIAYKNANQLKKLVDQVFELAHLEVGQVSVNIERFPLNELLHDIAAKFQMKLQKKNVNLSIKIRNNDLVVSSDIEKLERILSNLIENAIRHTSDNGKIILTAKVSSSDKVVIEVTDNGTGIAKKEIPYIFDPRYRASNSMEDTNKHGGLGLAISQKLVALLSSKLSVESQLGIGTTFSVHLNTSPS